MIVDLNILIPGYGCADKISEQCTHRTSLHRARAIQHGHATDPQASPVFVAEVTMGQHGEVTMDVQMDYHTLPNTRPYLTRCQAP